ncbi:MAG: hypothetical protein ACK4YP_12235, partial [Myxococcota bacterium]
AVLPDAERRPAIAELADRLLLAVAETVPVSPVPVVAVALGEGVTELGPLKRRVGALLEGYRAAGRPIAKGLAYGAAPLDAGAVPSPGRANPALATLDADIGASEEAERTVDLALRLLARRGLVAVNGGRVTLADDATPILAYYARSLEMPTHRARAWSAGDPARTAS